MDATKHLLHEAYPRTRFNNPNADLTSHYVEIFTAHSPPSLIYLHKQIEFSLPTLQPCTQLSAVLHASVQIRQQGRSPFSRKPTPNLQASNS